MEEEDYSKLSVKERCVHKVWKARLTGYQDAADDFRKKDEMDSESNSYSGLIKKFVIDSNAAAQEKGLEAALAFVENCYSAGTTVGDVMNGLVQKCVGAPKARTKDLAIQITLKYIELEKQDNVLEELMKGTENKNPKISASCIHIITISLKEFGTKVINVNIILKRILPLLEERDKNVRDEAKACIVELYRWMGPSLKPHLTNLKSSQLSDIEAEYGKQNHEEVKPLRLLKSQQIKKIQIVDACPQGKGNETKSEYCDTELDPFEHLVPVDIISKLPQNFYSQLEAKKWSERKEALDALEKLSATPKIENCDYSGLIRSLKNIIQKDPNVVVVGVAIKCVTGLAKGLRKKFNQYSSLIMPCLLDKFKERKQNVLVPLRDAIDAVYLSTDLDQILEDVISFLENKNPNVKAEVGSFLARCFYASGPGMFDKKSLKPLMNALLKSLTDQDQHVRDNAACAFGVAMMVAGEKTVSPFLVEVDNVKLTKIKEYCEKARFEKNQKSIKLNLTAILSDIKSVIEEKPSVSKISSSKCTLPKNSVDVDATKTVNAQKLAAKDVGLKSVESTSSGSVTQTTKVVNKKNDGGSKSPKLLSTVAPDKGMNIKQIKGSCTLESEITEQLISELMDKHWKTRSEAVNKLHSIIKKTGSICPDLGEAPPILAARISDSNSKIAVASIALVESLAIGMGPQCKQHTGTFLPPLIKHIGDSKVWIRTAALTCIKKWYEIGGYKEFFEDEIIADALKSGSPSVRTELWNFLAMRLPNIAPKALPKEELMACLPALLTNVEDRNLEVRKSASDAVLGFMLHLGFNSMNNACEIIKGSGNGNVKLLLEKTRGSISENLPTPKSKQGNDNSTSPRTNQVAQGCPKNVKLAKSRGNKKSANVQDKTEIENETDTLLPINNLKNQRIIDELKLKTLKWNFTTPRTEYIDLLKENMIAANINKNLITNMFHNDFRYHLKAIDSLTENLSPNELTSLSCNLDLILRWLTLRFFDTNPSVLLKILDYLHTAFNLLESAGYQMLDYEANSFIPYLILKFGDPKDVVRNNIRALFKQISNMFPVTKQFTFIMEGVKTKNSRQRSECLDHLGWIIENYGLTVCQPNVPSAIRVIASYIADRDTNVRNAAINCIVTSYFIEGEKITKMVGHIAEKDMFLLEERIKRVSKNRPALNVKPLKQTKASHNQGNELTSEFSSQTEELVENHEKNVSSEGKAGVSNASVRLSEEIVLSNHEITEEKNLVNEQAVSLNSGKIELRGPFTLDQQVIDDIEKDPIIVRQPQITEVDLEFFKEPVVKPSLKSNHVASLTSQCTQCTQSIQCTQCIQNNELKREILKISESNIEEAIECMIFIDAILNSDKRIILKRFINIIVDQMVKQLINLRQSSPPEFITCYAAIFSLLLKFLNYPELCMEINENSIYRITHQLILLLVELRLEECDRQEMLIRNVNTLILKCIDNLDKTNVVCALINLLYDRLNDASSTALYKDLLIKCLWKLNRAQPNWDPKLDYKKVLLHINIFFIKYPSSWWKTQESDVPFRTVKTFLYTMIKLRDVQVQEIVKNLSEISQNSELYLYINKLVRHIKSTSRVECSAKKSIYDTEIPGQVSEKIAKEIRDELREILKMIIKGDSKEISGSIKKLYLLKKDHPEIEINRYLTDVSPTIQKFIENAIADFENTHQQHTIKQLAKKRFTRKISNSTGISPQNSCVESDSAEIKITNEENTRYETSKYFKKEAQRLWTRLQFLKEQAGLPADTCSLDEFCDKKEHQLD